MKLNKIGIYLLYFVVFLMAFIDLYFYFLRCEFSPPISILGSIAGIFFQLLSITAFSGILEYSKFSRASKILKEKTEELKILRTIFVIFLFLGIGVIFQAFLRSDAMTVRGARSIGDACFSSPNLFLDL